MDTSMSVAASIVIPTYKRHDLLRRCLQSVCEQRWSGEPYEVIVADDSTSDTTREFVMAFAQSLTQDSLCSLRYVPVQKKHGPAAARNVGWRGARGQVIAFTDDDCIPSPTWLMEGVRYLNENPGLAAAWGKLIMPLRDRPTDYERDAAGLASAVFVTANCFVRRSVLADVQGFDENFRMAWREDTDLYFTLLEHGHAVGHAAGAVVEHPIRPARWGISIAQQKKSRFDVLLYRKHPELYRRFIAPFPILYLLICGAGLSSLLTAMFQAWAPSVLSLSACLLLSGAFAMQRLHGTRHSLSHLGEMFFTSLVIPWLALYNRLVGLSLPSGKL